MTPQFRSLLWAGIVTLVSWTVQPPQTAAAPLDPEAAYIQVAAMDDAAVAETEANRVQSAIGPALVLPPSPGHPAPMFRVLIGPFPSRGAALSRLEEIRSTGETGLVRSGRLLNAVAATSAPLEARLAEVSPVAITHQAAPAEALEQALLIPAIRATSESIALLPQARSAFTQAENLIAQIPDSSPAKAHLTVQYARQALKENAYTASPMASSHRFPALQRIARGELSATRGDWEEAVKLWARSLHYFQHDRLGALGLYKPLASHFEAAGRPAALCMTRMQYCAASMELCFELGLLRQELLPLLDETLEANRPLVEARYYETSATARQIRWTTARVGLMKTEVLMESKRWSEALQAHEELVALYGHFPECQDEMAESYNHRITIAAAHNDEPAFMAAYAKAREIATAQNRPIWGDPRRDVLFKTDAKRRRAVHLFKKSHAERLVIEIELLEKYPNVPGVELLAPYTLGIVPHPER